MAMRDKLIEWLLEVDSICEVSECCECVIEACYIHRAVDHLIAHGVTLASDTDVGGKKPLTNADRIRAMSDVEMAEYFNEHFRCPPPQSLLCLDISCEECWTYWLKQPAKEE